MLLKRIAVLIVELLAESLLLGCLVGAMISGRIGILNGMIGSILAVPVMLALHGYYVSRVFAAVAWASKTKWIYPATAATVFIAHVVFFASRSTKSDFTSLAQALLLPFIIGGAGIVFACALAGNQVFFKRAPANMSG